MQDEAASMKSSQASTAGGTTLVAERDPSPVEKTIVQPSPRRRGGIACRRCRRLRTKCVNENGASPCEGCRTAGSAVAAQCTFLRKGERDMDRDFRRRPLPSSQQKLPQPGDSAVAVSEAGSELSHGKQSMEFDGEQPAQQTRLSSVPPSDTAAAISEGVLPPLEEMLDGCRTFMTYYFQLGFTPKAIFIENLNRNPSSVSPFLISCILSISARFCPALVRRYGSAAGATDHFLAAARGWAATEMYRPSLERTQAFFLLAISEWGNGDKDRSSMDMGVAVRMASLLKLHREETYQLPAGASAEQIVRAESARRTFWMIQSQENLHSGYSTPAPFALDDITALLPCDESDFAFGIVPAHRAALAGTPPATANPRLTDAPDRCMFATLVQAHTLWGQVARRACRPDPKAIEHMSGTEGSMTPLPPWNPASEYAATARELREFEDKMPARQAWSVWNLRGWRADSLHLAYLAVTPVLRLSNIVLRRIYLEDIMAAVEDTTTPTSIKQQRQDSAPTTDAPPEGFWARMSDELFANVRELHEQIDAYFSMRTKGEGFPAILVFCVYICGSLASYLWKNPALCPAQADGAEEMAMTALQVLGELHGAWPTSARWRQGLQQIASAQPAAAPGTPGAGSTSPASGVPGTGRAGSAAAAAAAGTPRESLTSWEGMSGPASSRGGVVTSGTLESSGKEAGFDVAGVQMETFPSELFDAELAAILSGDLNYGFLDDLQQQ
ncbi:uncharacterized protein E0L32_008864 [Thyridium curvatum]|uniref:Zn(2)-C6 fungal-type domain-containing protein n=1 Tax=Thyridium curvatum TaxID=1093900 RepID=A0A507AK13_9PEZI|nr:uncharacterized protein E0L32_008864 [Thyridium curvatum]TPX09842.1 hypothetical protein E0L32_008864 [Thyridium curvatum]